MKRKLYIYINGIFNWPGRSNGWTDRAVTWTHTNTDCYAEKLEYYATFINSKKSRRIRADKFSNIIELYKEDVWDIVIVGHSNGCEVALKMMDDMKRYVSSVHLISAACERDFGINGLNQKLIDGKIGKIHLYGSSGDLILKIASYSDWCSNIFSMGYGLLGLKGPKNIDDMIKDRVFDHDDDSMGHSTWVNFKNFENTIKNIMRNDNIII